MEQSEEELEKLAWEVYAEVLKGIEIPDYASIQRNDDGTFSCMLRLSYKEIGSSYVFFKPSIVILKDLLQISKGDKKMPVEFGKSLDHSFAVMFAYLFLKNFFAEMKETIENLQEIPFLLPQLLMNEITDNENEHKKFRSEQSKKNLEKFFESRKQRVKKRIEDEIQRAEKPKQPVMHLIDFFYKGLLPKWENAKDCYKKIKNLGNWEKMIAVSFDDLPKDLLLRLGDPDTYLAMPSSIALEHSARICGIKPNSVGLRALQKYLQQSREWIKENGDEKADNEAKKYINKAFREVIASFTVADAFNEENFPFEKYSLMHQIIAEEQGDTIKKFIAEVKSENKSESDEQEENDAIH